MKSFNSWATAAALLVLALMAIKSTVMIYQNNGQPEIPNTWEGNVFHGAQVYFDQGITSNSGLPIYPMDHDTPIQKLRETRVYTHFLPGDSYLIWAMSLMTRSTEVVFKYGRFVPLILTLFLMWIFSQTSTELLFPRWRWAQPAFLAVMAIAPNFYKWSISLSGVGFSSVCVMLAMLLPIRFKYSPKILLAAFVLGFVSMYLLMTQIFVLCFAPIIAWLLSPQKEKFQNTFKISIAIGLGITTAYILHFFQVASFLESWALAWQDQMGTFFARGDSRQGISRLELIAQYSGHVRSFFRVSVLQMLITGLPLIALTPELKSRRLQLLGALLLSTLACYIFPTLMRHTALMHWHVFPHIFMMLYAVWVFVILNFISQKWMRRHS